MKQEMEYTFVTPAILERVALDLWGAKWRDEFCAFFDMTYSQLHRYMTVYKGQTIPKRIAVSLEMLEILKVNEIPFPSGDKWKVPASEATAVKFVAVAKPKVPRIVNDAPEIDMFGLGSGDDETEEQAETEEQVTEPPEQSEPEPEKSETGTAPEQKPKRTRTKKDPTPPPADKPKRATSKKKAA
jgi:hypothetical protein